jgi:hypothetical protein
MVCELVWCSHVGGYVCIRYSRVVWCVRMVWCVRVVHVCAVRGHALEQVQDLTPTRFFSPAPDMRHFFLSLFFSLVSQFFLSTRVILVSFIIIIFILILSSFLSPGQQTTGKPSKPGTGEGGDGRGVCAIVWMAIVL